MESSHYRLDGGQPTVLLQRRILPATAARSVDEDFEEQLMNAAATRLPEGGGVVVVRFWFGSHTAEACKCGKIAQQVARRLQSLGCTILIAAPWWKDGSRWEQGGVLSFEAGAATVPVVKAQFAETPKFDGSEAELVNGDSPPAPPDVLELVFCTSILRGTYQGRRGAKEPTYSPGNDTVTLRLRGALASAFRVAANRCPGGYGLAQFDPLYSGLPWLLDQLGSNHPVSAVLAAVGEFVAGCHAAPDPLEDLYD